jgi:hypothetical protein
MNLDDSAFNTRKLKSGLISLRSECKQCGSKRNQGYKNRPEIKEREREIEQTYYLKNKAKIDRQNKEYCSRPEVTLKRKSYARKQYIEKFGDQKFKTEKQCRKIFEDIFQKSFPKSRPSFLINPKTNHPLELDGYCEELNLGFEYDGEFHYGCTSLRIDLAKIQQYDELKNTLCTAKGLILIRIPYWEKNNLENFIRSQLENLAT